MREKNWPNFNRNLISKVGSILNSGKINYTNGPFGKQFETQFGKQFGKRFWLKVGGTIWETIWETIWKTIWETLWATIWITIWVTICIFWVCFWGFLGAGCPLGGFGVWVNQRIWP